MGASISTIWAFTRATSLLGDPGGLLETTDDMVGFADSLRTGPLIRSRGGEVFSSDYEVCSSVLRCSDASADIPVARNILESLPDDRPFDLVRDLAAPLPMAVICEILGVPYADRHQFSDWGGTLAEGLDRPRSLAQSRRMDVAAQALVGYLGDLLEQRRANPAGDLLSAMASAQVDGDRLDNRNIVGTASFLLLAGFETTVNLLGAGTEVLLRHPQQFAEVSAEPQLIPDLVEAALRYVSPVQYTFRTALAPIELRGREVLGGAQQSSSCSSAPIAIPMSSTSRATSTSIATTPASTWPSDWVFTTALGCAGAHGGGGHVASPARALPRSAGVEPRGHAGAQSGPADPRTSLLACPGEQSRSRMRSDIRPPYQMKEPRVNPRVSSIRARGGRAILASSGRSVVEADGPR